MSDDKKQMCGRHFVSGQGIVTICGDAPAPSSEGIVGEFWEKIRGHDVQLHNDMTSWLRSALARHGDARYEEGKRDGFKEASTSIHTYELKQPSSDWENGHYAGKNEALAEVLRAAAREDGVEI